MKSHQLHALASAISRQERITHSEACARLARRPRRKSYGKTTVAPAHSTIEKPAAVYWWQKDTDL